MDGQKPFRKKIRSKKPKNSKNQKKIVPHMNKLQPHVNKKSLARKRIFVQTPFSHTTSKLEQKIFIP